MSTQQPLQPSMVQKQPTQPPNVIHPPTRTKQMDQKYQMSRIYRTFSTKKYQKFRHQYPRMRQTEIINKIIKEWQSMSEQDKLELGQSYNKRDMYDSDDDDSNGKNSHIDSRSEEHKISDNVGHHEEPNNEIANIKAKSKIKLQRIAEEKAIAKVSPKDQQQAIVKSQNNSQSQLQDRLPPLSPIKSQIKQKVKKLKKEPQQKKKKSIKGKISKRVRMRKTKPIKKPQDYMKLKNGEYLMFCKFHSIRLRTQHPKWSTTQINQIVELMWRKKQQETKKTKIQHGKNRKRRIPLKPKIQRPLSGKEYFTREKTKQKRLTKEQIDLLWKQLPRESKADWNKRGRLLGVLKLRQIRLQSKEKQQLKSVGKSSNMKSETQAVAQQHEQNNQNDQQHLGNPSSGNRSTPINPLNRISFRDMLLKGSYSPSITPPSKQTAPKKQERLEHKSHHKNDEFILEEKDEQIIHIHEKSLRNHNNNQTSRSAIAKQIEEMCVIGEEKREEEKQGKEENKCDERTEKTEMRAIECKKAPPRITGRISLNNNYGRNSTTTNIPSSNPFSFLRNKITTPLYDQIKEQQKYESR